MDTPQLSTETHLSSKITTWLVLNSINLSQKLALTTAVEQEIVVEMPTAATDKSAVELLITTKNIYSTSINKILVQVVKRNN